MASYWGGHSGWEGDVDWRTPSQPTHPSPAALHCVHPLSDCAPPSRLCSKKPVPEELELVETEDQITHEVTLEDALEPQVGDLISGDLIFRV